jgi:hypothetical protein
MNYSAQHIAKIYCKRPGTIRRQASVGALSKRPPPPRKFDRKQDHRSTARIVIGQLQYHLPS